MHSKNINKILSFAFYAIILIWSAMNLAKIASSGSMHKIAGPLVLLGAAIYFFKQRDLSFVSLIIFLSPFWSLPVFGEYLTVNRAVILIGLFLVLFRYQSKASFYTKETFFLIILALLMLISGFFSSDFNRAKNIWLSFFINTLMLYMIVNAFITSKKHIDRAFIIWMIVAFISAILTILQVFFGEQFFIGRFLNPAATKIFYEYQMEGGVNSGFGLFMHRGYNAIFICGAFVIALIKLLESRLRVLWIIPLLAIFSIAILISGSRTGVYLLLFSVFSVILLNNYTIAKAKYFFMNVIFILFLFILVYNFIIDSSILSSIIEKGTISRFNATQSEINEGRLRLWSAMLARMGSPFNPIGIGIGETAEFRDVIEIHNAYLEILVEVGALGFIVWMLFVFRGLLLSHRLLDFMKKTASYDGNIIISIVLLLIILQNLIIGMSVERGDPIIILPFALISALARLNNLLDNKKQNIKNSMLCT